MFHTAISDVTSVHLSTISHAILPKNSASFPFSETSRPATWSIQPLFSGTVF